jgi:hypothetical protein
LSKNPEKESGSKARLTTQKQDATMSAINEIVQTSIQLVALSASVKCDCAVCRTAKDLAPHVAKVLSLRKQKRS